MKHSNFILICQINVFHLQRIEEGCVAKTIGKCAADEVEKEAITLLTWYFMANYTRCDKDPKQKEIEDEAQRILLKYNGNYTSLYNVMKYDNDGHTIRDRRKSFRELIVCAIPEILKGLSGLKYGEDKLEAIPACTVVSGVLGNCFKENKYFSQREMNVARDLIASYYIFNMKSLRDNAGYTKVMKQYLRRFDSKKTLEGLTGITSRLTDLIIGNIQLFVNDFETDSCQSSMARFDSLVR